MFYKFLFNIYVMDLSHILINLYVTRDYIKFIVYSSSCIHHYLNLIFVSWK